MSRDEESTQLFGDLSQMLNGRMRGQVGPKCVEIETEYACAPDEGWMKRGEHDPVHDAADLLHTV